MFANEWQTILMERNEITDHRLVGSMCCYVDVSTISPQASCTVYNKYNIVIRRNTPDTAVIWQVHPSQIAVSVR